MNHFNSPNKRGRKKKLNSNNKGTKVKLIIMKVLMNLRNK